MWNDSKVWSWSLVNFHHCHHHHHHHYRHHHNHCHSHGHDVVYELNINPLTGLTSLHPHQPSVGWSITSSTAGHLSSSCSLTCTLALRSPWQPLGVWLPALWPGPVPEVSDSFSGFHRHETSMFSSGERVGGPVQRRRASPLSASTYPHSCGTSKERCWKQCAAPVWDHWRPHPRLDMAQGRWTSPQWNRWVSSYLDRWDKMILCALYCCC